MGCKHSKRQVAIDKQLKEKEKEKENIAIKKMHVDNEISTAFGITPAYTPYYSKLGIAPKPFPIEGM